MTKPKKRVVLGVGVLSIADCDGGSPGGWTIPTAYGFFDRKKRKWKPLRGCRFAVEKRVRLVAEILPARRVRGK
jgi:hypothetical protein